MDFLGEHQPEMLPGNRQLPPVQGVIEAPHGTEGSVCALEAPAP